MSSNGDAASSTAKTPSNAIDVGFSSISNRRGESSSQAESRSSSKRSEKSQRSDSRSKEEHVTPQDKAPRRNDEGSSGGSVGHRVRKSGGFLLDSVLANGSPRAASNSHGKRKAQDEQLQVDKRRLAQSRPSGESPLGGSPLSREFSMDGMAREERDDRPTSRPQRMDPAQLVQMALNLSESRKRHVSNSLQVPLPAGRRSISGPMSQYGTVRASSSGSKRASQLSGDMSRNPPSSNWSGADQEDQNGDGPAVQDLDTDNVFYTFSPATLSRAEKARKYFELASEHRRLLQNLPPLKPEAPAPGNQRVETSRSLGSVDLEPTRTRSLTDNKHALGRPYNPIQSLRNRRVRIREKRPFTATPDTWQDTERVKHWIDDVEAVAIRDPSYRRGDDQVHLPTYAGDDDPPDAKNDFDAGRHRRTATGGSIIAHPENSWTIEPTELLADAYWTEMDDNKMSVETRQGNPIFPSHVRKSMDTPKISVEMHRDTNLDAENGANANDPDVSGKPSRRRRLMMPLKSTESHKHRRLISRASSTSSDSSTDARVARNRMANRQSLDENTGPLERHMQELIAKDEQGELSSPDMVSPDHWGAKHLPSPASRASLDKGHRESLSRPNGRASLEVPRVEHRRSRSADGRTWSVDHNMSSADDLDSEPDTPIVPAFVPSVRMDLSPPGNNRASSDQQKKGLKLPTFRSRSKERNRIGHADFANSTGNNLATLPSVESTHPRSSLESARPSKFLRHRTNDSMASSLQRFDTASSGGTFTSTREHSSSVGRFLKGGRDRIGGLVLGDSSRFRNRDKMDASDISRNVSDISDTEDEDAVNGGLKKRPTDQNSPESDATPRDSTERERAKPKYHLSNLPSFTSSARDKRVLLHSPMSISNDSITEQSNAQQTARRPERFDRLAPPRINLPNGSNASTRETVTEDVDPLDTRRKPYGELGTRSQSWWQPGSMSLGAPGAILPKGPDGLPITLRQRHWSIFDQLQPKQADKIGIRDVARVRALLMASGIKAREIQRRADYPSEPPPSHLVKAAETAGHELESVPKREEAVVAARILSDHLSSSLSNFERTLMSFQNDTSKRLASQLDDLQQKAADHLTKLVHDTSDEADAFTVELTTRQPQQTKHVDDAVDAMFRQRRRQFRLLRRAGFKLLEWLLLGIMWWIWFLVVVFNTGRKFVVAILRFLRWLFVW